MPKCAIQWIDDNGNPTPDDNEAVAMIQCVGSARSPRSEPSEIFPCCAQHLARMTHDNWRLITMIGAPYHAFGVWADLIAYLDAHSNIVHYQAPLDRNPVPVVVLKRFKNGKLRIAYHDLRFTADAGHLARFQGKA